jgi:hypothetical protein
VCAEQYAPAGSGYGDKVTVTLHLIAVTAEIADGAAWPAARADAIFSAMCITSPGRCGRYGDSVTVTVHLIDITVTGSGGDDESGERGHARSFKMSAMILLECTVDAAGAIERSKAAPRPAPAKPKQRRLDAAASMGELSALSP